LFRVFIPSEEGDGAMQDIRIILSALWTASMLTSLWGDVLRIYAGGFNPGDPEAQKFSQGAWLGIAVFMAIPIGMVFLSQILPGPANRWVNIVAAIIILGSNLISLPTYPAANDKFLMLFGAAINALTIWYAVKLT
jgi:hypothetical protein